MRELEKRKLAFQNLIKIAPKSAILPPWTTTSSFHIEQLVEHYKNLDIIDFDVAEPTTKKSHEERLNRPLNPLRIGAIDEPTKKSHKERATRLLASKKIQKLYKKRFTNVEKRVNDLFTQLKAFINDLVKKKRMPCQVVLHYHYATESDIMSTYASFGVLKDDTNVAEFQKRADHILSRILVSYENKLLPAYAFSLGWRKYDIDMTKREHYKWGGANFLSGMIHNLPPENLGYHCFVYALSLQLNTSYDDMMLKLGKFQWFDDDNKPILIGNDVIDIVERKLKHAIHIFSNVDVILRKSVFRNHNNKVLYLMLTNGHYHAINDDKRAILRVAIQNNINLIGLSGTDNKVIRALFKQDRKLRFIDDLNDFRPVSYDPLDAIVSQDSNTKEYVACAIDANKCAMRGLANGYKVFICSRGNDDLGLVISDKENKKQLTILNPVNIIGCNNRGVMAVEHYYNSLLTMERLAKLGFCDFSLSGWAYRVFREKFLPKYGINKLHNVDLIDDIKSATYCENRVINNKLKSGYVLDINSSYCHASLDDIYDLDTLQERVDIKHALNADNIPSGLIMVSYIDNSVVTFFKNREGNMLISTKLALYLLEIGCKLYGHYFYRYGKSVDFRPFIDHFNGLKEADAECSKLVKRAMLGVFGKLFADNAPEYTIMSSDKEEIACILNSGLDKTIIDIKTFDENFADCEGTLVPGEGTLVPDKDDDNAVYYRVKYLLKDVFTKDVAPHLSAQIYHIARMNLHKMMVELVNNGCKLGWSKLDSIAYEGDYIPVIGTQIGQFKIETKFDCAVAKGIGQCSYKNASYTSKQAGTTRINDKEYFDSIAECKSIVNRYIWSKNVEFLNDIDYEDFENFNNDVGALNFKFVHGIAGCGKSFEINKMCDKWDNQGVKYIICSSTGVSACTLNNATTLHSRFCLGTDDTIDRCVENFKKSKKNLDVEYIVIDEISMIGAKTINKFESLLRHITGNNELPFGGIKIIVYGDMYQLDAIGDQNFTYATVFEGRHIDFENRNKSYRHRDDAVFASLLKRARLNKLTVSDIDVLNTRVVKIPENTLQLYSTNKDVERLNKKVFDSCKGAIIPLDSIYSGRGDILLNQYKKDNHIVDNVKEGLVCMVRANYPNLEFVNGTICKIVGIFGKSLKVDVGGVVKVLPKRRYKDENNNCFALWPLSIYAASTVHKSQGLTIDNVAVCSFRDSKQLYVAISRVRALKDLYLKNRIPY
jgi:hypothetical protein